MDIRFQYVSTTTFPIAQTSAFLSYMLSVKLRLVNKNQIFRIGLIILKYQYKILQKSNIEILEFRYQLKYRFKMVSLV